MISISDMKTFALRIPDRLCTARVIAGQILLLTLCIPICLAQNAKPALKNAGQTTKTAEAPIKISGIHYIYGTHQDPFLNPLVFKKPVRPDDEELSRGLPPPGIAGTYIAQAVLQGTSIRDERRMAVVRGADTRAYFLKEGDRLFDGYLKTIGNDFITLVREIKMRSGKTLTEDVIKRLRTP